MAGMVSSGDSGTSLGLLSLGVPSQHKGILEDTRLMFSGFMGPPSEQRPIPHQSDAHNHGVTSRQSQPTFSLHLGLLCQQCPQQDNLTKHGSELAHYRGTLWKTRARA